MIATASGIIQDPSSIDLWKTFGFPLIQYAISPAVVLGAAYLLFNKTFNLGKFQQEFATAIKDIDNLKKDGKKLLSHVDIMKGHLVTNNGLNASLFGPGSPLKLLEAGIKLLDASGFRKIYEDDKTWFVKEIKKYNVKTLGDIDEASQKVIEECRDDNKYVNFKEIAFQNGVTLDVLLRVLAIYLRD